MCIKTPTHPDHMKKRAYQKFTLSHSHSHMKNVEINNARLVFKIKRFPIFQWAHCLLPQTKLRSLRLNYDKRSNNNLKHHVHSCTQVLRSVNSESCSSIATDFPLSSIPNKQFEKNVLCYVFTSLIYSPSTPNWTVYLRGLFFVGCTTFLRLQCKVNAD